MNAVNGWWFSEGYKLPYGDGRIIKLGETHKIKGEIIPCKTGLHASERIIDALIYAPGAIIWKVELSGIIIKKGDKLCASSRKYMAGGIDCSDALRKFARLCALEVVDKWDAPQVVIDYLKTGDEAIRSAAESAAWSAVRAASRSDAESATESAARSSARFAAWSAAESAAESAARSAACYTARSAAWYTARSAAWYATESAQDEALTELVNELLEPKK